MEIRWPVKSRELHSHHFDSTIWNDLAFRDDDIVISIYTKAGTTWMQQIVGRLSFGGSRCCWRSSRSSGASVLTTELR